MSLFSVNQVPIEIFGLLLRKLNKSDLIAVSKVNSNWRSALVESAISDLFQIYKDTKISRKSLKNLRFHLSINKAIDLLEGKMNQTKKLNVISSIFDNLIYKNHIDQAIELANLEANPVIRSILLEKLSLKLPCQSSIDKAVELTHQIIDSKTKDETLYHIAIKLLLRGNSYMAVELAGEICNSHLRERFLQFVHERKTLYQQYTDW